MDFGRAHKRPFYRVRKWPIASKAEIGAAPQNGLLCTKVGTSLRKANKEEGGEARSEPQEQREGHSFRPSAAPARPPASLQRAKQRLFVRSARSSNASKPIKLQLLCPPPAEPNVVRAGGRQSALRARAQIPP